MHGLNHRAGNYEDYQIYKIKKAATELREKQKNNSQLIEDRVSVDGKQQQRSYTLMNGWVAALSILTRKVMDIEFMSSFCRICKKLKNMLKNIEYESLKADHMYHFCGIMFSGSVNFLVNFVYLYYLKEKKN